MTKNAVKTAKEFDLIKTQHIIVMGTLTAVFASMVVIQDQKEAMDQVINHQRIETRAKDSGLYLLKTKTQLGSEGEKN